MPRCGGQARARRADDSGTADEKNSHVAVVADYGGCGCCRRAKASGCESSPLTASLGHAPHATGQAKACPTSGMQDML